MKLRLNDERADLGGWRSLWLRTFKLPSVSLAQACGLSSSLVLICLVAFHFEPFSLILHKNLNQKRQCFACFSLKQNDDEIQAIWKDRARRILQSPEETFRRPPTINKKQRIFHSRSSDSQMEMNKISVIKKGLEVLRSWAYSCIEHTKFSNFAFQVSWVSSGEAWEKREKHH